MIFNKYILLFVITIFFLTTIYSQNTVFEKVSKQYSIVFTGESVIKSTYDNIAKSGFGFELDYAWKLSGYNKKKNVFLSLPIGYKFFKSTNNQGLKVLEYGWKVRHELRKNKNWTPYLAYSLLLNQNWFEGVKGSTFGHQTRFSFGINKKIKNKLFFNIILNYSLIRIPSLNNVKADRLTRMSIGAGLRFG